MTGSCVHRWFIRRESLRRAGWRLRVRCSWCGKERLWKPWQGTDAVNVAWWRRVHPGTRIPLNSA